MQPSSKHPQIKANIQRAFDKAAKTYDKAAFLQTQLGEHLLARLPYFNLAPENILELGASTGNFTSKLHAYYPEASCIGLDISSEMLKTAQSKMPASGQTAFVCADMETLPFKSNSFDLVCSNVTIQWALDYTTLFKEIKRVLKPNGLWLFTTFGPDTLIELRQALASFNTQHHVNQFMDMHDIGDAMLASGLQDPVLDVEHISYEFSSPLALLKNLKALGANHALDRQSHGLNTSRFLNMLEKNYLKTHDTQKYPAHYEIIFGHAFAPKVEAFAQQGQTARIPLESIQPYKAVS